jgi:hypothetical protein
VFPESRLLAASYGVITSRSSKVANQSICADLLEILKEILSYGIGALYARHGRGYGIFLHEPFSIDSLNRAVLGGKPVD